MDSTTSKSSITSTKTAAATTTTVTTDASPPRRRLVQNFLLVWVDGSIDESKQDCQDMLAELRCVINDINLFKSSDECVDFLSEVEGQKAFMIVTGTIGEQIVPLIHEMPQLDTIYILCDNKSRHEQWSKVWGKVKGVYTQITSIYEAIQQIVKQYNEDSIAVSFVAAGEGSSKQNLDQLEPSFMYTQIFKDILLEMKYDRQSIEKFSTYCRNNDYGSIKNINRFEDEYNSHSAIWWYTSPTFIFSLLNQALRSLEADTIIHMGFFIHDLHHQIAQLHQQQLDSYYGETSIVYRGQSLLETNFENLSKMQGGLMSFNNFLSTSKNREVSLDFAEVALTNMDMVGILFKMTIDPSISTTPFAAIDKVSYFNTEEEILFSMHTVFRIGEIKKIDKNNRLYQVDLKLTGDDDQQLRTLTELIRKEVSGSGWERLGGLLIKIGQFNKAEELYTVLLEQTSDEGEKGAYYSLLGCVKDNQGDYEKAIRYHEKGLKIKEKTLSPNDLFSLATSYINIGVMYDKMGDYSKALLFYKKTRKFFEETLPPNHPDLATFYNNIGAVYRNMGEYPKALSFYEKALEIYQKTLPPNHPSLATSYNNIALEICQKTLPPNHPDLAMSYNNIGTMYVNMGEYSKALSFYEKALEIYQKTLPPNHPDLATSYNNIGSLYNNMGEYSKELSFYKKALEIYQKTLSSNHPLLATSYGNIGSAYVNTGEYSKALSFYEKALEICQKNFPPNHPWLATSYNNIGEVYRNMREYSKALSSYEKALEIYQKTLSSNHPLLATSYGNIGSAYVNTGEYSKALSFYEKTLEIREKALPHSHPSLATSYNNIAIVYFNMKSYSKALLYLERALDNQQRSLPPNHPDTQNTRMGIEIVKKKL